MFLNNPDSTDFKYSGICLMLQHLFPIIVSDHSGRIVYTSAMGIHNRVVDKSDVTVCLIARTEFVSPLNLQYWLSKADVTYRLKWSFLVSTYTKSVSSKIMSD